MKRHISGSYRVVNICKNGLLNLEEIMSRPWSIRMKEKWSELYDLQYLMVCTTSPVGDRTERLGLLVCSKPFCWGMCGLAPTSGPTAGPQSQVILSYIKLNKQCCHSPSNSASLEFAGWNLLIIYWAWGQWRTDGTVDSHQLFTGLTKNLFLGPFK